MKGGFAVPLSNRATYLSINTALPDNLNTPSTSMATKGNNEQLRKRDNQIDIPFFSMYATHFSTIFGNSEPSGLFTDSASGRPKTLPPPLGLAIAHISTKASGRGREGTTYILFWRAWLTYLVLSLLQVGEVVRAVLCCLPLVICFPSPWWGVPPNHSFPFRLRLWLLLSNLDPCCPFPRGMLFSLDRQQVLW